MRERERESRESVRPTTPEPDTILKRKRVTTAAERFRIATIPERLERDNGR